MPKLSIIIPVYNAENYLYNCIDSILCQTFNDFELLLINDGSADKSGEICDLYAQKDSRIRVYHKRNEGASSARNFGLDVSTGEWISFIDSDDWIDSCLYERMIDLAAIKQSDIVVCGVKIDRDGKCICKIECPKEYTSVTSLQNLRMIEGPAFSSCCNKLIKRELFEKHKIRYDSRLQMWDDLWVMIRLRSYEPSISIDNSCYYHYQMTERPSITKSCMAKKISSQLLCSSLISSFFLDREKYTTLVKWLHFHAIEELFDEGCYTEWKQYLTQERNYIWQFKQYYGILRLIQYIIVAYGGSLGERLLTLYKKIKGYAKNNMCMCWRSV